MRDRELCCLLRKEKPAWGYSSMGIGPVWIGCCPSTKTGPGGQTGRCHSKQGGSGLRAKRHNIWYSKIHTTR